MSWKEWFDEVPYPEDEGEPPGYTRRKNLILWGVAILLWTAALLLHSANAQAARFCRLVTAAYPEMQISLVSKECWEVLPAREEIPHVNAPVPKAKPLIQIAASLPIAKHKARVAKLHKSACGSKRQVWRALKSGHRKYRCK